MLTDSGRDRAGRHRPVSRPTWVVGLRSSAIKRLLDEKRTLPVKGGFGDSYSFWMRPVNYAFAGFSPRVNPGAGRNSGRTTLGSVLGAACGGGVGGVRGFSGSGLPSIRSFTSLASITSC